MSVGQSKGIRARQGKANRLIDETNRLVSEHLTPHTTYFRFDAPKEPYIVSEAVRAMLKDRGLIESDVVNCTYTQTVQLTEPVDDVEDDDLREMVKFLANKLEEELSRQMMGSNEYVESLRAAKVDVPSRTRGVIADLTNLT